MIGRVELKYCSTRPMTLLWPIRIGFCPTSGGGPHRQEYTVDLAEEGCDVLKDALRRKRGCDPNEARCLPEF
jgi:hypothetical protein